jgi:hypothetical protein
VCLEFAIVSFTIKNYLEKKLPEGVNLKEKINWKKKLPEGFLPVDTDHEILPYEKNTKIYSDVCLACKRCATESINSSELT